MKISNDTIGKRSSLMDVHGSEGRILLKMDIKVVGCEYVSWIYVASWQDVRKQIINLRVPDCPETFCLGFASDCIFSLIYISR